MGGVMGIILVSGLVECLIADCVNHDLSLSLSRKRPPKQSFMPARQPHLPPPSLSTVHCPLSTSPDRLGFSFSFGSTCSRLTLSLRT